ncbi:MAG: hypothetical protein DRP76_00215 [Candidatus Omnitrophota bacterium]|nr:MAG: hypothetical protein DRP76_00215 [Candidatus Omnitrophota bacterium]
MRYPNIILITVDSLRADHLGFMGYSKNTTPFLDSLVQESTVFSQAYSCGPVTPHSFPAILTSTYPFDYLGPRYIDRPRVLISEVFKQAGFVTATFNSNTYISSFFGYDKGWDFFEDLSVPYETPEGYKEYIKAKTFFNRIIKDSFFKKTLPKISSDLLFWIIYVKYRITNSEKKFKVRAEFKNEIVKEFLKAQKHRKTPFFLWVHYMDTHIPYVSEKTRIKDKPLSFLELAGSNFGYISSYSYFNGRKLPKSLYNFGKKHLYQITSFYDDEIKYLDSQMEDFFTFLKREGFYDNSVISLTADHGDEFLEHNGTSHFQKLYNELLHVPLVIKYPRQKNKEVIDKKVSLIDLAPTLCDLAGVDVPKEFKGNSMFKNLRKILFHQTSSDTKGGRYYVFGFNRLEQCKIACQSKDWKYIIDFGKDIEELYNLNQDPKEQVNLVSKEPDIISQMRAKLSEFIKENPPFSLLTGKGDV